MDTPERDDWHVRRREDHMRVIILAAIALLAVVGPAWAAGPNVGLTNVLLWDAVTTNEDGSPVTDLAGYEVLICTTTPCNGASSGVIIRNVGMTSVPSSPVVSLSALSLSQGQKYAVVRAYDTGGNRSAVSNEVPFVFDMGPSKPLNFRIQ